MLAVGAVHKDASCVQDASTDPRFRGNPLVTSEPKIRLYAGADARSRQNGKRPPGSVQAVRSWAETGAQAIWNWRPVNSANRALSEPLR